jgi:hypothetical protein
MNLLQLYIDFNIKFKLVVGNKLNYDIKKYIWDIYKKDYAINILIREFKKIGIMRCRDCDRPNWGLKFGYYQKFYYTFACNTPEFDFTDTPCCKKYICTNKCRFKINCKCCNNLIIYRPLLIEGKKEINISCNKCNYINNKKLVFKDEIHNHIIIGKLI